MRLEIDMPLSKHKNYKENDSNFFLNKIFEDFCLKHGY